MSKTLEKFLRKRNSVKNNVIKSFIVYEKNFEDFEFFNRNGFVRDQVELNDGIERNAWEFLNSQLCIPLDYFEMQVEASFVEDGFLLKKQLATCLKYGLMHNAIAYYRQKLALVRYGRELRNRVAPHSIFNLAIATMIERHDKADNLFEFLSEGYSRGWINRSKSHLTDFMLLLFAQYKAERLSCTVNDFAYQHIVDDWDTADPDKIISYITLLCDEQVMQVAAPPSKCLFEFNNMNWQFIPYPALMLLALRKARGIDTPYIEHPAFGKLNDIPLVDGEDVHDEVFAALTTKLKQQGFDMNAIFS